MKTFKGENVTKKHIAEVIRTKDVTRIYQLYFVITGQRPEHFAVSKFFEDYAPTVRLYRWLSHCWMDNRNKHTIERQAIDTHCFYRDGGYTTWPLFQKQRIVDFLKKQCQDVRSNYAKRPMMGHTHLYFCSPVYGHSDYNKWCALPIEGNERFCETVIKYADKFFNPVYNNK